MQTFWSEHQRVLPVEKNGQLKSMARKMEICKKIEEIFKASKSTYGSPRIFHELRSEGFSVSENTVAKYMREMGLDARLKKKYRVRTTNSNHEGPIAPRVFRIEDDLPKESNQVLAGDITYLRFGSGFFYLAIVLDVCTRKVVGWSVTDSLETTGVLNALRMALANCRNRANIVFHSDRGIQYASKLFLALLNKNNVIPSMSRKGNCYDNSIVESWFKSFKSEWLYRHDYKTEAELRTLVFEYIEIWYNKKRLHSSLGYQSPLEYESTLNVNAA
ncbi:MAG: IS3 family transposase [Bdellovibrionales bacterium]|nr:IS3 family transposase [Bdellovibrionales bacterium]